MTPSAECRADFKRTPYVHHRFELRPASRARLQTTTWSFGFGAFSEVVYHDNGYCRRMKNGKLERWPDTIERVVNGVMSIRKDWYVKHGLRWDEGHWQELAEEMALAFLRIECGPPGRGYALMGTDYVYERGAMALINCAATELTPDTLDRDLGWAADALASGSGVGFGIKRNPLPLMEPFGQEQVYVVPDTREGWAESVQVLIRSFMGEAPVAFKYHEIRPRGAPLKSYGGVATGSAPLELLHSRMRETLTRYCLDEISSTRCQADLANQIGACIKAGPRSSAEILCGDPEDPEFLDLKDYEKNPDRADWGWASNNSPRLTKREHFALITSEIAPRAVRNGEPGFLNMITTNKFARFGREKPDPATLYNPCAEQPLTDKEVCNLSEVYPSRTGNVTRAAELACLYSSTVALLPTHRHETNRVVAKHRRIGVSMSGISDWQAQQVDVTRSLRVAYEAVVAENRRLAHEAGVPASIRCTTVKPGGTVPLEAGVSPGGHFAMGNFYIRRKVVHKTSPFVQVLDAAGYPSEQSLHSPDSRVYEFPIHQVGKTQSQAGPYEQALQLAMLQREWADGAVSFTVQFPPGFSKENLASLMAYVAPMVKTMSVLPESHGYAQAPYEEMSEREYKLRCRMVKDIDWSTFDTEVVSDADKFCTKDGCQ